MPNINRQSLRIAVACVVTAICFSCIAIETASAGMPALLPSGWTAENPSHEVSTSGTFTGIAAAVRLQAISFFVAIFLLSAWLIKRICNSARQDFPALPKLSYGRSLGLLTLWGLAFVVVLTMISGARELMTPGAWQKQGWTYKLASTSLDAASSRRDERRKALEQLRTAVWQFAAINNGRLPNPDEPFIAAQLWQIPANAGLQFMPAGTDFRAEESGRLYVFEPDIEGDERLVLLTNGFIGTMSSDVIKQTVAANDVRQKETTSADSTTPSSASTGENQ